MSFFFQAEFQLAYREECPLQGDLCEWRVPRMQGQDIHGAVSAKGALGWKEHPGPFATSCTGGVGRTAM